MEIYIELSDEEIQNLIDYIQDYLVWFREVAIPLYAEVFADESK